MVIVTRIDRLARSTPDLLHTLKVLANKGVGCCGRHYIDKPENQLNRTIANKAAGSRRWCHDTNGHGMPVR